MVQGFQYPGAAPGAAIPEPTEELEQERAYAQLYLEDTLTNYANAKRKKAAANAKRKKKRG
jgi:hypothetical protein